MSDIGAGGTAVRAGQAADEALAAGRRLFAGPVRFVAGAAEPAALPPERLPEVAFAGRSNVGKSSLVNALTGRRLLARTSNTPGRTRQINFFDLAGRLLLVDLPGYGYAAAPKSAAKRWAALTRSYLQGRTMLRRVCLLIDARRGLKDLDREVLTLLDRAGVSYQIVLTKTDTLAAAALAAVVKAVTSEIGARPAAHPEIHLTSALERQGIDGLRTALAPLARSAVADAPLPGVLAIAGQRR
jgi:GTP-binding protein